MIQYNIIKFCGLFKYWIIDIACKSYKYVQESAFELDDNNAKVFAIAWSLLKMKDLESRKYMCISITWLKIDILVRATRKLRSKKFQITRTHHSHSLTQKLTTKNYSGVICSFTILVAKKTKSLCH